MKDKLLTLGGFDRAKAWIEAALQDLQRTLAQHDVHVYRELTGTAAVTANPYTHAKWDVVDENVTEYRDGMIVCIKVPVAGHGTYGTGLQINSLGYKPIVYNVSSMISTRYSVGSVVWAVYNATQKASLYVNSASASTITGCWQVMDYDSNTTAIYNLVRYNGSRIVQADLLRYVISFRKNETTIVPIHSNAGTGSSANTAVTATTKTMTTESFDPFGEIYYYATNTKISAGELVAMSTMSTQRHALDARYIFNCAKTLTSNKELYLVVDLQSDGMVKLASTPWAQTLPSTNDGHLYILLGYTYSSYQFELYYYHPIYYHDGTWLRQYGGDKTFSGNYNDLTNKPTIPDAVSGQNDGTNWTSLTIGNTTKAIPQGGDSLPSQTGNSGKFLTTNGTDASWASAPGEEFVCTFTSTTSGDTTTYSCDKTIAEIYAAYQANKKVVGYYNANISILKIPLVICASGNVVFSLYTHLYIGVSNGINQIGSITFTGFNFPPDIWYFKIDEYDPSKLSSIPESIGDLSDVNITSAANDNVLKYDSTSGKWVNGTVSALDDYDFTHTSNTTVSTSTTTVTFAADQRGSAMLTISADLGLTIACNNGSDNYIWIKNTGSAEVDVTISAVTLSGTSVSNVYVPSDGITVPAGGLCEIGVIVNGDGAFITSRNDLAL